MCSFKSHDRVGRNSRLCAVRFSSLPCPCSLVELCALQHSYLLYPQDHLEWRKFAASLLSATKVLFRACLIVQYVNIIIVHCYN
ncbi:hypothetical protein PVAP13_4KG059833 [Panicum virgatum]|uniref:Uncharacterized protein n=1 Tax=Panicum virgatum TaxID=38727 RepID=A0A8T0TJ74_PANVG|nr:hypothetical protein PVAP13_4KG059833 [Panicum virgatum]